VRLEDLEVVKWISSSEGVISTMETLQDASDKDLV
jgi:hypothetical protein